MAVKLNIKEQNLSTFAMSNILVFLLNSHFFAISHVKEPVNGTGGTVKRLAAKANLQRVYNNQIHTSCELFNYCSSNIHNITLLYVQEEQILNHKMELTE
jgi:hypothetical protein